MNFISKVLRKYSCGSIIERDNYRKEEKREHNSVGNYFAIYRCPMCGTEFRITNSPTKMREDDIPELLARVVKNQQLIGSQFYEAPIYLPHKCGNGNGGIAQLIGFRKIE